MRSAERASRAPILLATALACVLAVPVRADNPRGDGPAPQDQADPEIRRDPAIDAGAGQAPQPVHNLVDALALAYAQSPTLEAERARAEASRYRIGGAYARSGPSLTYEARYGYQRDRVDTATGPMALYSGWSSTATAILTQPLFTFGRNASDVKTARAQSDYQEAVLQSAEIQTLLNTITVYASVLRDRNGLLISQEYLSTLERELSDNVARFRKREVTATDVRQAKTRIELGREQLLAARRQAAASEAQFIAVVGAAPGPLDQPNPLAVPVTTLAEAIELGSRNSPIPLAAQARERISRFQVSAMRADYLPRLDFRGSAEMGGVTRYSDRPRQSRVAGEFVLSGPLFDSGLRQARLAEASATNDADWRLVDVAVRENKVQVADAWNLWVTQNAAADRLLLAISDAQLAYDGAVVQERAGLRSTLEVLDLARDLLNAKTNFNAANALGYIAQARLLAAMGTLTASNLLPDDRRPDQADRHLKGRQGGGIPLLTPLLVQVDSINTASTQNRDSRDASVDLQPVVASSRLDLSPDLEIPKD